MHRKQNFSHHSFCRWY